MEDESYTGILDLRLAEVERGPVVAAEMCNVVIG